MSEVVIADTFIVRPPTAVKGRFAVIQKNLVPPVVIACDKLLKV
jgi:hypothetical protein